MGAGEWEWATVPDVFCSERPLLIVAAVMAEVGAVRRGLGLVRDGAGLAGAPVYRGRVEEREVVLVVTGMGRRRARGVVRRMVRKHRPRGVLSVGFAGGVNPGLRVGEVFMPARVRDGQNGEDFYPALRWDTGETPVPLETPVSLTTVDRVALSFPQKAWWRDRGADAVDMETTEIARVCEREGVHWMSIRAMSDAADDALPPFAPQLTRRDGRADVLRAMLTILADPRRIVPLFRLARRTRRAARALGEEVERVIERIGVE